MLCDIWGCARYINLPPECATYLKGFKVINPKIKNFTIKIDLLTKKLGVTLNRKVYSTFFTLLCKGRLIDLSKNSKNFFSVCGRLADKVSI